MKLYRQLVITGIVLLMAAGFSGCEDDVESNANEPAIPLMATGMDIKAPGKGQYRIPALSGENVSVSAHVPADVQSLTITKTVNLQVDPTYGENGVLTVDPSSLGAPYEFTYTPPITEIDQLVGFTFFAERSNGSTLTSDLTLVVTFSPKDNIPFRRWNLVSKIWVDGGNVPDLKECEKDEYYLFNSDGTMSLNHGTTPCDNDGLIVYDTWQFTEDEQSVVMIRHKALNPNDIEMETYRVVKLTTEELVLDIDLDLSLFGLTSEETFRYFLKAAPK